MGLISAFRNEKHPVTFTVRPNARIGQHPDESVCRLRDTLPFDHRSPLTTAPACGTL